MNRLLLVVMALTALTGMVGCGPAISERGQSDARGLLGIVGESREVELPADSTWLAVALDGGMVYVVGQADAWTVNAGRSLLAIDAASGEQRWRAEFDLPNTGMTMYSTELTAAGDVLLYRTESMIVALSKRDGAMLWHIEDSTGQLRYVDAQDGTLYTVSMGNRVTAWSMADGTEKRSWDLQGYTFSTGGYGIGGAWLTTAGTHLVGIVDPGGGIGNEIAVILLDLQSSGGSPQEIMRSPINYQYTETMVGPAQFTGSTLQTYGRSDYVVKVTQADKTTLTGWSVLDGASSEPAWTHEIPIVYDQYGGYANNYYYYAPKVLLLDDRALLQEPMSAGVLLNNVLRIHGHELSDFDRTWTNVLPTQHYIASALALSGDRILVLTRNEQGNGNERWYGFDAGNGELVWASPDQEFVGATRGVASDSERLVRLTTVTQADSRLFIDDF